ncbi:hypothetical protein H257_10648 [Aphanomyces astaci]|uniref:Endonuclease/exonuclease/phosphatase domain-containing protein n=1 Tax=Aphanomyces astaci TaxID=112090 RepID=W4G7P3_APHAT|nr:hypothetical protein H257_10648 [Aphanomyces astaci]ETV75049.1 hypothetical protein H257_10648 [Aphanomyces astaci]|eukprot:XP_009835553.1 hypothetical protein H257_10648 [Aphanomyces astaci]
MHGPHPHRSKGVATFFHSSMPGFASLKALWSLRVPDRYLVVRTEWDSTPVYFHNVYAPVESADRAGFFASLPRDFEPTSRHFVGGDFNLPMDAALDTTAFHPNHHVGKDECCEWLSALRVVDAWRTKEPNRKVLTGPRGRNRLDYVFADVEMVAHFHVSSTFDRSQYNGDHMTHTTTFAAARTNGPPTTSLLMEASKTSGRTQHSIHALGLDFTSVVRSSSLDEYHSDDVSDATVLLNHESECILALAEILLVSLAPCYYAHDVAPNAATSGPVFALPARSGDRYLASSTLCTVLLPLDPRHANSQGLV